MADFKKYALAFAGLTCMLGVTGTASAQTLQSAVCVASATPLDMRAEGITELAGDIVLSCTGGTPTLAGQPIPLVNITVAANTNITSRLLNSSSFQSEAVLLVDEPTANLSVCPATIFGATSCAQPTAFGGGGGINATQNPYNPLAGSGARYNGYQGTLVNATSSQTPQVTFFGVPFDPPATGQTLVYRITNLRLNASAIGAGTAFTTNFALVNISTSAGFTISNATPAVGNVRRGLVFTSVNNSATNPASTSAPLTQQQCTSTPSAGNIVEYVNFGEGFATATKGNNAAATPVLGNNNGFESGFAISTSTANGPNGNAALGSGIGVADFGTRVKLTFNNIPTGVTVYVPTSLNSNQTVNIAPPGATPVLVPTEFIRLTASETGGFSAVSNSSSVPGFAAITATSGTAVAVYEVNGGTTTPGSTGTIDTYTVPVVVTYTANPGSNSPGLGTSTVSVDFAPTSTTTIASSSANIPRFTQTSSAINGFAVNACSTILLFPFVTNLAGFDTGLAIANTSSDPFGTTGQAGSCVLNFYGSGAPAAFTTPSIAPGTVYPNLASTLSAGFQGYIIAQCRFQFAHGFAFVTDGFGGPGRGLSEGYLALVIPDPGQLGGKRVSGTGEALGQ